MSLPIRHDVNDDHPSLEELRAVVQPDSHIARYNAEHWSGGLYMRHLSLRVTRRLLPTGISPNGVTWLMVAMGVIGAFAMPFPGVIGPIIVVLAMQLQILLDCCDGEVARWRQRFSPTGIYLDRIGHYLTEAALPIALGLRAGGYSLSDPMNVNGWTVLGLIVAVAVLLNKAFTDLVHVARVQTGRAAADDVAETTRSRVSGLAALRRAMGYVPVFRAFVAVEASLIALVAAVVDTARGDLAGSRVLLLILVPMAIITAVGHLVGVLTSARLD